MLSPVIAETVLMIGGAMLMASDAQQVSATPRFARAGGDAIEVVLDPGRPKDDLSAGSGCGGRRARPEGRHCGQRLGKGPVRPPGPATPQNAHQEASSAAGLARNCRRQQVAVTW